MFEKLQQVSQMHPYQVKTDGKMSIVDDPLFSVEKVKEHLDKDRSDLLKALLETGCETKKVRLQCKLEMLSRDLVAARLQKKCVSSLKYKIKGHIVDDEVISSDLVASELAQSISRSKQIYKNELCNEISENQLFYRGAFLEQNESAKQVYMGEKHEDFCRLLDPLLPTPGEPLKAIVDRVSKVKDKVTKQIELLEKQQSCCIAQLEKVKKKFTEAQTERQAAARAAKSKDAYKDYKAYLEAIERGEQYVSIPVSMLIDDKENGLLHCASSKKDLSPGLISLLLDRGADPIAENADVETSLKLLAKAYAKKSCKEGTSAANCFLKMVEALADENSAIHYHHEGLENLEILNTMDEIYKKAWECLRKNVKLLHDLKDIQSNEVTKLVLAFEKNLVDRVEKYILIYKGLLEALSQGDENHLFRAIDEAYEQDSQVSENFASKGRDLHRDSSLIIELVALKRAFLANKKNSALKKVATSQGSHALVLLGASRFVSGAIHRQELQSIGRHLDVKHRELAETIKTKDRQLVQEREAHAKILAETKEASDAEIKSLNAQLSERESKVEFLRASLQRSSKTENDALALAVEMVKARDEADERLKSVLATLSVGSGLGTEEEPQGNNQCKTPDSDLAGLPVSENQGSRPPSRFGK